MRRGWTVVLRLGLLLTLLGVLLLPSGTSRAAGLWTTVFFDDFTGNTGWNVSPSGDATTGLCFPNTTNGNTWPAFVAFNDNWGGASTLSIVQNSAVRSSSPGNGGVVFGLVGRTGLFSGVPTGQTWAFELRWLWSYATAYGTNIFLGSGNWDPARYGDCSGNPHPDWLNAVHAHFRWDANPCCRGGWIDVFGRRVYTITSRSVGEWWITLRVEARPDGSWTAWVNGSQVGQGTGAFRPNLVAFGNFYEQSWWGNWTNLHLDYFKIETQAPLSGSLSGPTDIARALGAVAFTLSASDPWGRLQQVRLFRSPVAYRSWKLLGTFACSGSSCWVTAWYDPGPDPPGLYWFVMDATSTDGRSCTGNVGSPGFTLYGEPLPAGVTDCGPSSRMQVRLWDPVTFTGRVTRLGDGAGLSGVRVDACLDGWNCYRSVWTDGAGNYTLQEPRPWVWNGYSVVDLVVRPPGGYGAWSAGPATSPGWVVNAQVIRYPVSARGSFGGLTYGNNNYTLAWWITFTGRVYNRTTGAGMSGVAVVFRLDGWNQVGSVTTDGAGNYTWSYPSWPPGGYAFLDIVVQPPANWVAAQAGPAASPGWVVNAQVIRYPTWASGGTTYGNNNFGLDGQYAFSGRVTRKSDGAALAGVTVRLLRESDGALLAQATTDGAGNYTIGWQGYPTGNLLLRVVPPAGYVADAAASTSGGQALAADTLRFGANLSPGSYGGNTFVLAGRATFSGRVIRRSDGAGLAGVTVEFWTGGSRLAQVQTDGSGNFTWTHPNWPPAQPLDLLVVVPANYQAVQAQAPPPAQVLSARTIRYPITAPPGTYPNNTFTLAGVVTFSGQVVRSWDGRGVAGATVQLLLNGAQLGAQATTDAAGNWSLTYTDWPVGGFVDLVLAPPAGYLPSAATAPPPGQVIDARTIRYAGTIPVGSYPNNVYRLTVPPPPPPGGTVGGGQGSVAACQGPCLILQGGRLSPPTAGLSVVVEAPPNRDDITQVEVELRRLSPADGRVDRYVLPVAAGQTQVVVDRTTTGDPTLGEKAVGTWEVWARFRSVASGPGPWAALGRYTVLWLPARLTP